MCNCECQGPTIRTQIYVFRRDQTDADITADKPRYIKIQNRHHRQQSIEYQKKELIQGKKIRNESVQIKKTQNENPNVVNGKKIVGKIDNERVLQTPKINLQLTLRLVQEDNQFLRRQMIRLKKQERQIVKTQSIIRSKYSKQINNLIVNSQEIRQRSSQRKKDLEQLRSLLQWRKKIVTPANNQLKIPQMPRLYTQQSEKLQVINKLTKQNNQSIN